MYFVYSLIICIMCFRLSTVISCASPLSAQLEPVDFLFMFSSAAAAVSSCDLWLRHASAPGFRQHQRKKFSGKSFRKLSSFYCGDYRLVIGDSGTARRGVPDVVVTAVSCDDVSVNLKCTAL